MQPQRTGWVDSIRYLRGLGPPPLERLEANFFALVVGVLSFVTLVAALHEFG